MVGGRVQRREAALLAGVRVRAGLEQRAHRFVVADGGGRVQRVHAERVVGVGVGSAPMASSARTASAPPKNAARCSGVKPSAPRDVGIELLDVAERGGLERADLGPAASSASRASGRRWYSDSNSAETPCSSRALTSSGCSRRTLLKSSEVMAVTRSIYDR